MPLADVERLDRYENAQPVQRFMVQADAVAANKQGADGLLV